MTVGELAQPDPIAATRQASIGHVAAIMRDENVGSVVIVEDEEPVGIITDRDIAVKVTAEGKEPDDVTAEEIMTPDPVTVERETGVMELTRVMAEHSVRRIPVVDDGKLDGIITLDDVDKLLSDERQHLTEVIEAESPAY
ncbi:MAG: CBS domain-containing protein [Halapricum sp.]